MAVQSWMVRSWPSVDWLAPQKLSDIPAFSHMGTQVRSMNGPQGKAVGDTVWATLVGDKGVVGVAWEWIELVPGVLVISDVNGLVSNARFMTQEGLPEDELRAIAVSNLIAYSTPWQNEVMSYLHPQTAKIQPHKATADEIAAIVPQRIDVTPPQRHAKRIRRTQLPAVHAAQR
jgi:hypothetical protein